MLIGDGGRSGFGFGLGGGEAATDWETLSTPPPNAKPDREPNPADKPSANQA